MAFSKANFAKLTDTVVVGGAPFGIFVCVDSASTWAQMVASDYFATVGQEDGVGDKRIYDGCLIVCVASDRVGIAKVTNDGTDTNAVTTAVMNVATS